MKNKNLIIGLCGKSQNCTGNFLVDRLRSKIEKIKFENRKIGSAPIMQHVKNVVGEFGLSQGSHVGKSEKLSGSLEI